MSTERIVNRVNLTDGLTRDLAEISADETKLETPPTKAEIHAARQAFDASAPILQQVLQNKVFRNQDTVASLVKQAKAETTGVGTVIERPVLQPIVDEEVIRRIVREELAILISNAAKPEQVAEYRTSYHVPVDSLPTDIHVPAHVGLNVKLVPTENFVDTAPDTENPVVEAEPSQE